MSKKLNFTVRVSEATNGFSVKYFETYSYNSESETLEVFLTAAKAIKRAKEIVTQGIEGTLFNIAEVVEITEIETEVE